MVDNRGIDKYKRFKFIPNNVKETHLKLRKENYPFDKATIISPTNKCLYKTNIFNNFERQLYPHKELIIILNNNGLDIDHWREYSKNFNNVLIFQLDEKISLGECLNYAIDKASGKYIAKFDDDDFYGPYYLLDQISNLSTTKNLVVGKASHYVYFESLNKILLCHPGYCYCNIDHFISGSSYVFNRKIFNEKNIKFEHRNTAEDYNLNISLAKLNINIYSTDPFNYLIIRRSNKKNHTWKIEDSKYITWGKLISDIKWPRQFVII